jgi:hypothetical protein
MMIPLLYSLFGYTFILILKLASTRNSETLQDDPETFLDLPERSVATMF